MKKSILAIAAVALVATSCNNAAKQQQSTQTLTKGQVESEVRDFVYPLPTAFDITNMLEGIGADYMLTLCNDRANVDKYLTETKRAVNLGIYNADVCYAATYNQNETVNQYLETVQKLIDELDITNAVDPELPSKIEQHGNNKDTLTTLITESFYDAYDYLNRNNRGPVSLQVVAGSWLEGLYIATHISEYTFNNKEIVKIIMTQKEPLAKLMELLAKYPNDAATQELVKDLQPIHDTFSTVGEASITESQCEHIRTTVAVVREKQVAF